jgi:glycosyltransferase involved in cell wall biosynthesis
MQVTYNSPNRSHHYRYAAALARAGCLHCFVSGFPRFGRRAALPEAKGRLRRADHLQNIYQASLRLKLPGPVSEELAYLSKIWIDRLSEKPARESDVFLFYSGAGLHTARRLEATGVIRVVEAVNSHVAVQEQIMREEHRRLGLPAPRFHPREKARRLEEYRLADAILCPSQFVKKSFEREGIEPERIFVVPYGIALHSELPPPDRDPALFRVLYVGQISPRKGLRYLFEAFSRLRHPRKELLIVGPTAKPTGLEGVTVPDGTRFLGVLKGDDLARAYRNASVFVLPTVEEGLALVLGEALSFGLPVIATENSGGADLFTDGEEGFLVPIRAPEAITAKMERLADEPALRERMSSSARSRARALQGWEETGNRLVSTLQGLARPIRSFSPRETAASP